MAGVIDALLITLGVDSSGVKSGMAQVENTIAASAKNIMNNILAPLAAALAIGSAFKEYLSGAQAVGNLANTLNENQEDIQAWGGAVQRAGGDASAFEGSLVSLNSKMLEFVQTGTSSAAPALAQLGISARDSNGNIKSSIDIMQDLARVADRMDPARFQAITASLGIDSGTLLLLKQGSSSVNELIERQKLLGVYTAEDSAIATKMGNAIKDLMQVLKSISTIIMRFVLPPLSWLNDKLVEFVLYVKEHEVFLRAVISGIAAVLTAVLLPAMIKIGAAALANPLTWIFLLIAAAVIGVSLLIEDLYVYMQGGKSALAGFWSIFGSGKEISQSLLEVWNKIKEIFDKFLDTVIANLKLIIKIVANLISFIMNLGSYLKNILDLIISIFTFDGEGIKKAFAGMWEATKALGRSLLNIIGYIKDGILNFLDFLGLKDLFLSFIDILKGKIQSFVQNIKEFVLSIKQFFAPLIDWIKNLSETISNYLKPVLDTIASVKDKIGGAINFVGDKISGVVNVVGDTVGNGINYVKNSISPVTPKDVVKSNVNNSSNITTNTSSVNVGAISVYSNNADPQKVAKEIPAAMGNYNTYIPANTAVAY